MYLEKPKHLIIWNGGGSRTDLGSWLHSGCIQCSISAYNILGMSCNSHSAMHFSNSINRPQVCPLVMYRVDGINVQFGKNKTREGAWTSQGRNPPMQVKNPGSFSKYGLSFIQGEAWRIFVWFRRRNFKRRCRQSHFILDISHSYLSLVVKLVQR